MAAFSIFPLSPGCSSELPRPRSPFAEPAADFNGCPSSSSLRLCRRSSPGFPRTSDAFGVAGFSGVLGCPSGSRLLLLRPRYRLRVAPRPIPPALPVMDRRVASIFTSFGGAGCESSGFPLRYAPPVSPTISIRVAPNAHPPAPADVVPSRLGIPCHPVRPLRISGLLRLLASGFANPSISRSPRISISQRRRFCLSRVAPKLPSSADP